MSLGALDGYEKDIVTSRDKFDGAMFSNARGKRGEQSTRNPSGQISAPLVAVSSRFPEAAILSINQWMASIDTISKLVYVTLHSSTR